MAENTISFNGRNISVEELIKRADANVDLFVKNKGLGLDFYDAYNNIVNAMKEGKVTSRDRARKWHTTADFSGKNAGLVFSMLGKVAPLVESVEEKKEEKKKYDSSKYSESLNKKIFGGTGFDGKLWTGYSLKDRAKIMSDLIQEAKDDVLANDYDFSDTAMKDKEDFINRSDKLIKSLNDGKDPDEEDIRNLVATGLFSAEDARKLFAEKLDNTEEEKPETEEEKLDKELAKREKELLLKLKQKEINDFDLLQEYNLNWQNTLMQGSSIQDKVFNLPSATQFDINKWGQAVNNSGGYTNYYSNHFIPALFSRYTIAGSNMNTKFNNGTIQGTTRGLHIANNLDYLFKTHKEDIFTDLGNGTYLINDSKDANNQVVLYDPNKHLLIRTHISKLPEEYKNLLYQSGWENYYTSHNPLIPSLKQGGILKGESGFVISIPKIGHLYDNYEFELSKQLKQQQKLAEEQAIKESGKSIEQYKHDNKKVNSVEDLSASDWTRIAAAVGDISGAIAAFIPGGSVYSFWQGVTSDVARAGADISDGASFWDTAKNFGKGLGMTALTSLPILGTEGKLAKALNGLGKFMPLLFSAGASLDNFGPAMASWEKILKDQGKVEDYKNILNFVVSTSSMFKSAGAMTKVAMMKGAAKSGENQEITVKGEGNSKITLKPSELATLQKAKSNEEMLSLLRGMEGHENDKLDFGFFNRTKAAGNHFFNRGISVTDSKTPVYDWEQFINLNKNNGLIGRGWTRDARFMQNGMFNFGFLNKLHLPYGPKSIVQPVAATNTPTATPVIQPYSGPSAEFYGEFKNGGKLKLLRYLRDGGRMVLKYQNAANPINYNDEYLKYLNSLGIGNDISNYYNWANNRFHGDSWKNWEFTGFKGSSDATSKKHEFPSITTGENLYDENGTATRNINARDLYERLQSYLTGNNSKDIMGDVNAAYESWKLNEGKSDSTNFKEFRKWYNAQVDDLDKQYDSFRNKGYMRSDVTKYNQLHHRLYGNYTGGYDKDLEQYLGGATIRRLTNKFNDNDLLSAYRKTKLSGDKGYTYMDNQGHLVVLNPTLSEEQDNPILDEEANAEFDAQQYAKMKQDPNFKGNKVISEDDGDDKTQQPLTDPKNLDLTEAIRNLRFWNSQNASKEAEKLEEKAIKDSLVLPKTYETNLNVNDAWATNLAILSQQAENNSIAQRTASNVTDPLKAAAVLQLNSKNNNDLAVQLGKINQDFIQNRIDLAKKYTDANLERQNAVFNEGQSRIASVNKLLGDLRATMPSVLNTNTDNYLSELYQEAKTNQDMQMQSDINSLQHAYTTRRNELLKAQQEAIAKIGVDKWALSDTKKEFDSALNQLDLQYWVNSKTILKKRYPNLLINSDSYNFNNIETPLFKKEGGRLERLQSFKNGGNSAKIRADMAKHFMNDRLKAIENTINGIKMLSTPHKELILKALGIK